MSFESFQAFVDMGGHGVYVWWSYAAGLCVLAYNVFRPLRARRRVLDSLPRAAAQPKPQPHLQAHPKQEEH